MSIEKSLEHFFKPEVRNRGNDLFKQDLVALSHGSDTALQAYVRGSTSVKVNFSATSIGSDTFFVDCNCSASAKGVFCKHIWATLLAAVKAHPDFFDSKKNIEKVVKEKPAESPYKAKQAEYQKQQYEKQKMRAKEMKLAKKKASGRGAVAPQLPEEVEGAMVFFADNGFPIELPLDEEYLKNAKKKLSRIFHPDKGGTHEETVILNENFDVLIEYFS